MSRTSIFSLLLIVLAAFIGGTGCYLDDVRLYRQTQSGVVHGIEYENDTLAWLGIPYAKPPTKENNLRWKAPVDPEPWKGIRESLESLDECIPCAQNAHHPVTWENTGAYNKVVGSEDCLTLNVWRPDTMEDNLPVYVWIHGGANNYGAANEYDRSVFASKAKAVVVVVQYRLGPFGWMTHTDFQGDGSRSTLDKSGNFGALDVIKALQWVNKNVKNFGGNPKNITVAGESAGAHNTGNLLVSPLANGLFQRVMMQSRAMPLRSMTTAITEAETLITRLAANEGIAAVTGNKKDYLESKSTEEIIKAYWFPTQVSQSPGAIIDGTVIPQVTFTTGTAFNALINTGNYNKVPVIIGNNMDEAKYFLPVFGSLVKYAFAVPSFQGYPFYITAMAPSGYFTWLDLCKVVNSELTAGSIGTTTVTPLTFDMVLPTQADKDLYTACATYGSLSWKTTYTDDIATALKSQPGQVVYAYYFKWAGTSTQSDYRFVMGAAHTTEIPFFHGLSVDSYGGMAFTSANDTEGRKALSDAMLKYVKNYIHTGNPNGKCLPTWEEWSNTAGESKCIEFDATDTEAVIAMSQKVYTQGDVMNYFYSKYMTLPAGVRGILMLFGSF